MLALLVAVTFAILKAGASLRPVRDLGGSWIVVEGPGERIRVQQSGLFLRFALDDAGELPLRWEEAEDGPSGLLGEMVREGLRLRLYALPAVEEGEANAPRRPTATHLLEASGSIEALWWIRRGTEPLPARS